MMKSKYAREQLERFLTHAGGPVTIRSLIDKVGLFTDDDDPRWIGAAVSYFDSTGLLRHVTCDANHHHSDDCTVEWIGAA